ncbi:MAG: anti-sigma factor [Acidobacteriota bacterium]|nr:anti-sigma factor [Acidobacteriota bacterium]
MKDLRKERLLELLADQTIFGLSEEEIMELGRLKNQFPDWEDDVSLELTAAMIGLSDLDTDDMLPANLRAKIFTDADVFFSTNKESQEILNSAPKANKTVGSLATESGGNIIEVKTKQPFWQWLGWGIAAVACVALAINLWLTRTQKQPEIAANSETVQTPKPELSVAQKREQLVALADDAVQVSFANPKNEQEVLGDVVWSNSNQKGFVRVRGLPANDAAKETYQLWIVDENQDPKTPLSGGVFNVPSTGEVIVPIDAQLIVKKPKMIAVTKEKPGGVVVSKPDRIVAVAKI